MNASLSPRPTRSTLRNRRIVMDLNASINGSYVGEDGLKGAARRSNLPKAEKKEFVSSAISALLVGLIGLGLLMAF
jgi:hypothetical protein